MDFVFKELKDTYFQFFDILPADWQDEIVPYWNDYKHSSQIYILLENDAIIGGGIVFSTCPPDLLNYEKDAREWFKNGYLYLGFIWISENKRGKNLGSLWLTELKKTFPTQNYWLLIEDEGLHGFYQRNDFVLKKTIIFNTHQEWLYSFNPLTQ